ncbi:unnamed protein product [Camellia sinensis]
MGQIPQPCVKPTSLQNKERGERGDHDLGLGWVGLGCSEVERPCVERPT